MTSRCESALWESGYREIEPLGDGLPSGCWALTADGCESVWAGFLALEELIPWLRTFSVADGPLEFRAILSPNGALVVVDAAEAEARVGLR
jgi:hypothetical protein